MRFGSPQNRKDLQTFIPKTQNTFNKKIGRFYDWPSYVPSSWIDFCKSLSKSHIEQEVPHCAGLSCGATLCSCG